VAGARDKAASGERTVAGLGADDQVVTRAQRDRNWTMASAYRASSWGRIGSITASAG
jgi:hypothetical protein